MSYAGTKMFRQSNGYDKVWTQLAIKFFCYVAYIGLMETYYGVDPSFTISVNILECLWNRAMNPKKSTIVRQLEDIKPRRHKT